MKDFMNRKEVYKPTRALRIGSGYLIGYAVGMGFKLADRAIAKTSEGNG